MLERSRAAVLEGQTTSLAAITAHVVHVLLYTRVVVAISVHEPAVYLLSTTKPVGHLLISSKLKVCISRDGF
jgi:hypothetical protein